MMRILFGSLILVFGLSSTLFAGPSDVCLPFNLKYSGEGARNIWLGVTIPEAVQKQIAEIQTQIRNTGAQGFVEDPKRIHATLKFLGSIDRNPEPVDYVREAIEQQVPLAPMKIKIKKIGVLNGPGGRFPKLVWAELDSEELHDTFKNIENALSNFCRRETRGYKPHITLFKFGRGQEKRPLPAEIAKKINDINSEIPEFEVKSFKLMQSTKPPKPNLQLAKFKRPAEVEKDPTIAELEQLAQTATPIDAPDLPSDEPGQVTELKGCDRLMREAKTPTSSMALALEYMTKGEQQSRDLAELRELETGENKAKVLQAEIKWMETRKKMAAAGVHIVMQRKLTAELEDKIVDADVCDKIYFTLVHNTTLFLKIAREGMEEVDKLLQQLN